MPKTATPLDYSQVMAQVTMLKDSTAMTRYRDVIGRYLRMLGMEEPAALPEHIAKGQITEMRSPRGMLVKRQIKAEAVGYPTYTTVTAWNPDGNLNEAVKKQADKIERWLTLCNEKLLDGDRVKDTTYDYELATPYSVWLLHCADPHLPSGDEDGDVDENAWPWSLEVTNPLTCYFTEQIGGPFVPKMLAREYTMLVADAQAKYPDADWNRLSPGRPQLGGTSEQPTGFGQKSNKAGPVECKFAALYTEDYTYHTITASGAGARARDAQGRYATTSGEVVWSEPNHTGDVPAVVVPGDLNESGGDGKKMVPIMLALLQVLANRNLINGLRATLAMRDRPDMIVNADPQQYEAMKESGMAKPASEEQMQGGGGAFIWVNGEPTAWVAAPNEDLDKLDARWEQEEQACVQALTLNADSSIAAASTAEAYWIVQGVQNRQLNPMLKHFDYALAAVDEMILHSIVEYDLKNGHPLYALQDTRREKAGQIRRGEGVALQASDVKDFNCAVHITTKQETEEQRERRGAQVWLMYTQGRISWEQVLASDVNDVVEQIQEINRGTALQVAANTLLPYLPVMLNVSMQTRAGVNLGLTPANIAGAGQQAPQPGPGGTPYRPQPAPSAMGGSEATAVSAGGGMP